MHCYKRDYDLLGYKYALMSQLATAGLNNVICMTPARDEAEFSLFPTSDVKFIHDWLAWTDAHISHLKRTVPLPGNDEVAIGLIDGTAAFAAPLECGADDDDNDADQPLGFVWLFNPGYTQKTATFNLDGSLSPADPCTRNTSTTKDTTYRIEQLYPPGGGAKSASYGSRVSYTLAGSSAMMLQVSKSAAPATASTAAYLPQVLGVATASVTLSGIGTLDIVGASGEHGTVAHSATVRLQAGACSILRTLKVNGATLAILAPADNANSTRVGTLCDMKPLPCGPPLCGGHYITLVPCCVVVLS